MANSSETNFKKIITKTNKEESTKTPPATKNIKVESNTEIENTSFDFNTLNYAEESINACDTGDESEWENDFYTDISG